MMGGLGYLAGGMITGLGQGMVKTAEFKMNQQAEDRRADAQMRREAALEALRHQYRGDEMVQQGEVAVKTEAGKYAAAEPFKVADDQRTAKREAENDDRQHRNRLSEIGAEGSKQERLARLSSGLSAANTRAAALLEHQLRAGDIADTFQGDDGMTYIIRKDGTTQSTGVRFNRVAKSRAGGSTDVYDLDGDSSPPVAAAFIRDPKTGKIVPAARPPLSSFQR